MHTSDKVNQLVHIIAEKLFPLVNQDYYLLECPYYGNIGDTLIWQGEMDFLMSVNHVCKGMHGIQTLPIDQLHDAHLVLFQGGGNFGDLWPEHQRMKFRVMERYPYYQYIFLPVSTHYEQPQNLQHDVDFLANYDAVICARDNASFQFLKTHFCNPVILVPDMAFYVHPKRFSLSHKAEKDLLILRADKEFKANPLLTQIANKSDIDVIDWPTFDVNDSYNLMFNRLLYRTNNRITDWYCRHVYKNHLIRTGANIITSHRTIYSTRLHAAILATLLGKEEIVLFDNSYGKNSSFYDTWLSDCEAIKMIR